MKTKKILFATALVASFASCTNDDIVEVQQGVATANRPTVENVQLNFVGEDADSRLVYNGNYAWESTDVIGALLMDAPRATPLATADEWHNKYQLVNYVNTSYPFAYDTENKVWSNDAKMLEGNYFFAYPWSSYDGERQLIHSLKKQTQEGVGSKVVAESFADNQFLLGYSQIKKGTAASEALTDVTMTPILGGIQFRIINNGTKTYHINQIVVKGTDVKTELTVDPTTFKYANYVGNEFAESAVVEAVGFEKASLLRDLVKPVTGTAGVAQLKVTGTKAERAISVGSTGYAVVMVNPDDVVASQALKADIYTDEGVIKDIDLTTKVTEGKNVLVDKAVAEIGYTVKNTVSIKFKDDALESIQKAEIVDNEDLMQLIEWNANSDIKVNPVATLVADDVEFTAEMYALLSSNENVTLTIENPAAVRSVATTYALTLAEGLPTNVLEYAGLEITTPVIVAGAIELTEKTQKTVTDMTITKEGSVSANDVKAYYPTTIVNEGIMTFGEKTIATVKLTNEKTGVINVAKGADVKGTDKANFVNNGKIYNNGYVEHITNNAEGIITLGENAALKDLVNNEDAEVNTANGIQLTGTNAGLINYVSGANINLTSNTGMVSAIAPATIAKNQYDGSCVNTLTLVPVQITTFNDATTGGIENVIMTKGSTLKVANKVALSLSEIIVKENAAIITNTTAGENASSVTVGEMTVEEDVELTNNGKFIVTATWSNEGIVYNNGYAKLPPAAKNNEGTFKYTAPVFEDAPADTSKADALKKALVEAVNAGRSATLEGVQSHINDVVGNPTAWATVYPDSYAYGTTYTAAITKSEFDTALAAVKSDNTAALKTALLADDVTLTYASLHTSPNTIAKLYEETYKTDGVTVDKTAKTVAYDAFRANVISAASGTSWTSVKASVKLAASALSEAEVDAILAAKAPTAFIWVGCDLDLAIDVWKFYDGLVLTGQAKHDYTQGMTSNTPARFVEWAKVALNNTTIATKLAAAGVTIDTLAKFSFYEQGQYEACAN